MNRASLSTIQKKIVTIAREIRKTLQKLKKVMKNLKSLPDAIFLCPFKNSRTSKASLIEKEKQESA